MAIQTMTQAELAPLLLRLEDRIETQCQTCDRVQLEVLRAKGTLYKAEWLSEQANLRCQSAFITLRLLEASLRSLSLHEDLSFAAKGNSDLKLVEMTDEEIKGYAKGLI